MQRCMLKGKIHHVRITEANVAYEGSVTIDATLMDAANIRPYEQVHVWSLDSGERLETYAIPGVAGSGQACMNGAAAHRIRQGETVIMASFAWMDEKEVAAHSPSVVFVDEKNRMRDETIQLRGRPRLVSG